MKPGIGTDIPGVEVDKDRDGVPDTSERDFAKDGESSRSKPDAPAEHGSRKPSSSDDDGGLESTRPPHGDVVPPASN